MHGLAIFILFLATSAYAKTRYYDFKIDYLNVTRLCYNTRIVAVNGKFPGPEIRIREGDRVIVNVTNLVKQNITIHWHGLHMTRNPWFDGPAYVTQCPIQIGHSFVYNFTVTDQRGTFFWHAHISWLRSTLFGAIIVKPKHLKLTPYPKPDEEKIVMISEWWNDDIVGVEKVALVSGGEPAQSDAYMVNGQPGDNFNCSAIDIEKIDVEQNKTYLWRTICNTEEADMFITISNHTLTLVATDGSYTKQRRYETVVISPGQTMDLLITADQPIGQYYIVVSPYDRVVGQNSQTSKTPSNAILRYKGSKDTSSPLYPSNVPAWNDTDTVESFINMTKSLNSPEWPTEVPQTVDISLYYVASLNTNPCDKPNKTKSCQGPGTGVSAASINNITFKSPDIAILQAYYYNLSGVFTTDFPSYPEHRWNYTDGSQSLANWPSIEATKVKEIPYGANVQVVIQGAVTLEGEGHPFHLHGYDFYVIGLGKGDYNETRDSPKFNLVDPPKRNTGKGTKAGWMAIRWKANNPGVWLLHCHIDIHAPTWGMETVFLVKNGKEDLLPPPNDLPTC